MLAVWLFVLPSMVGYVRLPTGGNVYLHTGELALLGTAFLALPVLVSRTRGGSLGVGTVLTPVVALALPVLYLLVWPWLGGSPLAQPSLALGVSAALYVIWAIMYAHLFHDDHLLVETFLRVLVVALAVAFLAYLACMTVGLRWLVHTQYGTPRLQGLLSEPSGWGPFLGAAILLGMDRRRWWLVVTGAVAAVLTKSPTTIACVGLAVPAYLLLAHRWRKRRAAIIIAVTGVGWWAWLEITSVRVTDSVSTGLKDQIVARLASGIANIQSGQTQGRNDRWTSLQAILDAMTGHGWWWTGIGPGSESYWRDTLDGVLPNSLPVYVAGSFGVFGVAALGVLLVLAVVRLRRSALFPLILPFMVASLINSAGGWESYKYAVLAMALACGTRSGDRHSNPRPDTDAQRRLPTNG
ncbi:hypothetical protein [Virgisporangium aurantiacum]|uniref:O-antigen ligase n=1 Tax=Virgisporangium aurantiacum TaxID=175570 RepID=A0A8J3YYC6_9ACTN|nr:hypothetical protein [Virgisporangium aurantiacum]GIJ53986.1 hypothetical protein Vau01_015020 [Virgisporangium aurantiacum]